MVRPEDRHRELERAHPGAAPELARAWAARRAGYDAAVAAAAERDFGRASALAGRAEAAYCDAIDAIVSGVVEEVR